MQCRTNTLPSFNNQEAWSLVILMLESYCRIFEQIFFSTLVECRRRIYYRTFYDEHNMEPPTRSSGNILRLLINCLSSNDSRSEETCCVLPLLVHVICGVQREHHRNHPVHTLNLLLTESQSLFFLRYVWEQMYPLVWVVRQLYEDGWEKRSMSIALPGRWNLRKYF